MEKHMETSSMGREGSTGEGGSRSIGVGRSMQK